jgi:hypothetical protein
MGGLQRVPAEVDQMLGEGGFELYFTLDLVLGSGEIKHIADQALTGVSTIDFGVINYEPYLREPGTMNESLTLAANSLDLQAQNVDSDLGITILGDEEALDGANAIFSYVFYRADLGQFQVEILFGEVQNAVDQDPDMQFQIVSHLSVDGSIGGHRTMQQKFCFARYKIDEWCNSMSPLSQGCTLLADGPNGCREHLAAATVTESPSEGNLDRMMAFLFRDDPLPGTTPPVNKTGVVDGGNDFNSYFRQRESVGGYVGRHAVPEYMVQGQ